MAAAPILRYHDRLKSDGKIEQGTIFKEIKTSMP